MNKQPIVIASLIVILSISTSGCAVHMAATAQDRKDIKVLSVGNHRDLLRVELGEPVVTDTDGDGNKYDIFKFSKGFTGGEKFFHAAGHGVMDLATLGLWEIVGTPSESMSQTNEIQVKVIYDAGNIVTKIIPLKDNWGEMKI